jgi:hypothetical protein
MSSSVGCSGRPSCDGRAVTTPGQRLAALDTLTAILRQDAATPWPEDPDAWEALLDLAARHSLLPAMWSAWRATGRRVLPDEAARAVEHTAARSRSPEIVLRRAEASTAHRAPRRRRGRPARATRRRAGSPRFPQGAPHVVGRRLDRRPPPWPTSMCSFLVRGRRRLRSCAGSFESIPSRSASTPTTTSRCLRAATSPSSCTPSCWSRGGRPRPASDVLACASRRDTASGAFVLASDTDTFVHLVAHAQLQDDTYRLLGLPMRAVRDRTAAARRARHRRCRRHEAVRDARCLARARAHLDAPRRMFDAPVDVTSNVRMVNGAHGACTHDRPSARDRSRDCRAERARRGHISRGLDRSPGRG